MPSTRPQIIVRPSVEQKERWARMAYRHGLSLSAWITEAAESRFSIPSPEARSVNAAAGVEQPLSGGHAEGHPEPQVAAPPRSEARPEGRPQGHSTGCPAHHVKGVRCKLCGETG